MTTFSVRFLGCKVSYADGERLRERLLAEGHRERRAGGAEVALVNTCCVTREAVSKSRQALARAARSHERVFATGCATRLDGVLSGLPSNVVALESSAGEAADLVAAALGPGGEAPLERRPSRVRAFVTIQDGCSFRCSYCVVPLVRGPGRSRPAAEVLAEIGRRAGEGHKEVVLSGINLGCYRDGGFRLPELVRAAGETPGLARLRLSSLEVNHLSAELIAALRETPIVGRHLHVPLQSGDDAVLAAMGRRYDAATFLRRVEPLRDFNLTSDVIVGFPGEDEAAFARTLDLVERAGITKVHVFPYSPRPGTATAGKDTVPARVKKERAARMRERSQNACLRRWRVKIGGEDVVLIDRPGRGYGSDYTPWLVSGAPGELVRVRARALTEEGIVA
jgi:threonylcarbamoyladenosine tRNA methylthiotransferase MtaB